MTPEWLQFIEARWPELWLRTGEHILLAGVSTFCAVAIAVPLGVIAHRFQGLRSVITGAVGILQTIPSLAMLALFVACLNQFGTPPALMALVLYALLPIVRNTLTGLERVPPAVMEAADGLGMTRKQRLRLVELPLAAPMIVAGIRTAAVVGIGIATLSAFIGAGGLGVFINRGLSLRNVPLILLGVVFSALLALLVDYMIGAIQWACSRRTARSTSGFRGRIARTVAFAAPVVLLAVGLYAALGPAMGSDRSSGTSSLQEDRPDVIRVGSKNFSEQLILGEIMAQLIEQRTDLRVVRKFDLGGTMICHGALVSGGIDLYPEYTGTALTAVLNAKVISDPDAAFELVARQYAEQFDLRWLQPFGFNNTYAITIREQDALDKGLQTISDLKPLASSLRAGWTFEFSERSDGYPGLRDRYGFGFGQVIDLESSLMYEALARKEVDVISAFATDGRIAAYHLKPLEDDLQFFPPYFAAPVIRSEVLEEHPELEATLNLLAGQISTKLMQQLNLQVDQQKRSPREVAREFLDRMPAP